MLLLPGVDAQYRLIVTAIGKPNAGELITAEGEIVNTGLEAASAEKIFRTLPYVNCECFSTPLHTLICLMLIVSALVLLYTRLSAC